EYISQDGTKRSSNQVSGKFFNRITTDDVKKRRGPKAVATITGVVESIKDDLDSDGLPSGKKILKGFNVDFFGELRENSKPIIPFEAVVEENLADAFENLYDVGDTDKLSMKIENYAKDASEDDIEEQVSGFGSTEGLQNVIGGTESFSNGQEYDEEQILEAKEWRKKALDKLEESYVPSDVPSDNAFGQGSKKEKSVSEEDIDAAIDDLDF